MSVTQSQLPQTRRGPIRQHEVERGRLLKKLRAGDKAAVVRETSMSCRIRMHQGMTKKSAPILDLCRHVLSDLPLAVVLSTHTPGITPLVLENTLADVVGLDRGQLCSMEMLISQCGRSSFIT